MSMSTLFPDAGFVPGAVPSRVLEIQSRIKSLMPQSTAVGDSATLFADALDQASSTSDTSAANASSSASGGVTGDDVVTEAKKYLGVPYVWGGLDPSTGLDCSGLTSLVYKNLGITLPAGSYAQIKAGTPVASLDDAKPGDLIFYENGGHVGIYIGNGQILHSPHTGDHVRIGPVWQPISAIRRIIPDTATTGTSSASATSSTANAGAGGNNVSASIPYAEMFNAAGAKYGVSPKLLAAVAKTESNFNPRAQSGAGAQGLMQFMPATARGYGIDPWDPAQAIDGAARYLKSGLQQFNSTELAVASYNAGAGAVQQYKGIPPFAETQAYVRQVMQNLAAM